MMDSLQIAHTSDSHFSERLGLPEIQRVHHGMVEAWRVAGVDLIVHTGDVYDAASTPAERNAVATFLMAAADVAPVVVVKGNHDRPRDLEIMARLRGMHPINVLERSTVAEPLMLTGASSGLDLAVLALPWIDAHRLRAGSTTPDQAVQQARQHVSTLLGAACAQATAARKAGQIPILAVHAMVTGSRVSSGQIMYGTGLEFSWRELLDVGAACCMVGHVHKHQAEGSAAYAGSPTALTWGEPEDKTWNLWTVRREAVQTMGALVPVDYLHHLELERVPTGATTRATVDVELDRSGLISSAAANALADWPRADRVRLRVTMPREAVAAWHECKGTLVSGLRREGQTVEPVIVIKADKRTARAADYHAATTTKDKLLAWLNVAAEGADPRHLARNARLLDLVDELQTEGSEVDA